MEETKVPLGEHFATYKQYKDDTDSIAGWLTRNALRCGFKIPTTPVAKTSRLKGKARKDAKAASPTGPKYVINVSDFGRMAKAIVSFKPKVNIPEALGNLFGRAIRGRRKCTQWYEEHLHGDDDGSNQRHMHFANALAAAWEILRPLEEMGTSRARKAAPVPSDVEKPFVQLLNRFSSLQVEKSSEQEQDTEPSSSAEPHENDYKLTDVVPVTLTKSEEDIEDDFIFAILAFLQELDDTRTFVQLAWRGYRDGRTELIQPSLITNTAIQLVRRAEHELELLIERPKKYPASAFPAWTFLGVFMMQLHKGQNMPETGYSNLDIFIKPSPICGSFKCSHAELSMWDTFSTLKQHLFGANSNGKNYITVEKPNDADDQGNPDAFRRIKDMLPGLQVISGAMSKSFATDEITSGIGVMMETETIPIWVTFGVQLLLDIQDELESVPEKPLQEVQQDARNSLLIFRHRNLDREPFLCVSDSIEWLESVLGAYELDVLGDNFRKICADGLLDPKTGKSFPLSLDELRNIQDIPKFCIEPDHFLRINPVKCGMLKYGLHLQEHHWAAKTFEKPMRICTSMAHLYVACRSLFPEDPVWPDMEFFLHHQDLDDVFFGGLPSSMGEAYKKFLLALGVKPTAFARNRRTTTPQMNMEKGRWVSNPSLLDSILVNWMCGGSLMTDDMILSLMNSISNPEAIKKRAQRFGLLHPGQESEFCKAWSRPDRSMTDILNNMTFFVTAEASDFYFDWLSFAEGCQIILDHMASFLQERGDSPKVRSAATTVTKILSEAKDCEWVAQEAKVDVTSFLREYATALVESREAIQDMNQAICDMPPTEMKYWKDAKAWESDKNILTVLARNFGQSHYPYLAPSLTAKLYKNWDSDKMDQSCVILANTHINERIIASQGEE